MNGVRRAAAAWLIALSGFTVAGSPALAQPFAQDVGHGAVRFFASEDAFKAAPASFVLEVQPRRVLPMPEGFPLRAEFGTIGGRRAITVHAPEGTSLYGLGTAPGALVRSGFKSGTDPVECPWVMGVRADGTAFGVLMDTTYRCWADLSDGIVFTTDAASPGVILFDVPGPRELLVSLNELTGRLEMPPRWALGMSALIVGDPRGVARRLRQEGVPADAVVLPG